MENGLSVELDRRELEMPFFKYNSIKSLFGGPAKGSVGSVSSEVKQAATMSEQKFGFSGSAVSDVGRVRPNNEDNYVLGKYTNSNSSDHSEIAVSVSNSTDAWQFAGVFDGMGGGEAGELASKFSAEIFLSAFSNLKGIPSKTEVDLVLRKAFLEANNRIIQLQQECRVFGTTGTVLCANGMEFKIYHLGDSRAYLVRENELFQLTKDQTLAQMKIDVGLYDHNHPQAEAEKHKLTEYIGRDRTRESIRPVESLWNEIQSGDQILLCSDGLYDMCTSEEISNILGGEGGMAAKAARLVKAAVANGGIDNVTCVLVAFT